MEDDSELIHGFRMVGIEGEGPANPLPGAGKVARGKLELTPCDQGLNLRGIEGEGAAEAVACCGKAFALALEGGEVDPAGDEVGAKADGAAQSGFGGEIAALFTQQAPKVDPGGGIVRPESDGATIARFGFAGTAQSIKRKTRGEFGLGIAGTQKESIPVVIHRLIEVAKDGMGIAKTEMSTGKRGLASERDFEFGNSLLGTARRELQLAEAHAGQRVSAAETKSLMVGMAGVSKPASCFERLTKGNPAGGDAGIDRESGGGHADCVLQLPPRESEEAHSDECLGMRRIGFNHALVSKRSLNQS